MTIKKPTEINKTKGNGQTNEQKSTSSTANCTASILYYSEIKYTVGTSLSSKDILTK